MSEKHLIEAEGRGWLVRQLLRAKLHVALPEHDTGIDLLAYDYSDRDFIARPIQLKAGSGQAFGVDPKYDRIPRLLIVHVWNVDDPTHTVAYAMTYADAVAVADAMGWTKTASWLTGASSGRRGYVQTRVGPGKLMDLLEPHRMTPDRWRDRVLSPAAAT